jgi:hypothetical protein
MPLILRKPRALPKHRTVSMYRSQQYQRRPLFRHPEPHHLAWWAYALAILLLVLVLVWVNGLVGQG